MRFQTLSVVVGNSACNAHCPFCIAAMTRGGAISAPLTPHSLALRNLERACKIADKCDITTALITGKGEPTLFESDITLLMGTLDQYFPLIELQTNGLVFLRDKQYWAKVLNGWRAWGLTHVALSIVHYKDIANKRIYTPDKPYLPLADTIKFIRELGLTVRLNCIGIRDCIDTPTQLRRLVNFAYAHGAKQLSWRPVMVPTNPRNATVASAAKKLTVSTTEIVRWAKAQGTLLHMLPHGGMIFNIPVTTHTKRGGQNLCLTNCLTRQPDSEAVRQLIYVANNDSLVYDWECEGAVILG